MSILQRRLPPRNPAQRSELELRQAPQGYGSSASFQSPSLPIQIPTTSVTRIQEPVTNPPDMNSPVVRKGFPFWEKVGASCIWLTKCFVRGERYITSGYTCELIRNQTAQILANTFEPIVHSFRMKAVHLKIHDTNGLELDPNVIHPIVKVHILDINTGCYLRKDTLRPTISTYENIGQLNANKEVATGLVEFIVPFSTPPFDMRVAGECDPHWNQEFLINQDAAYLLKPDIVFLFEILDFHFKLIKAGSSLLRKDRMYPIAWGFLRPSGFTKMNLGVTKVQLYRYKFKAPAELNESRRPEVFYDFNWYRKELYPSFLRVELKTVEPPAPVEMPGRSLNPMEREIGIKRFEDFAKEADQPNPKLKLAGKDEIDAEALARAKKLTSWRRLYGEGCRVPTKLTYKFESSHLGCFRIAFSNNGKYLAAACTSEDTVIKIFQVEDGEFALPLRGHADLVHDLCWAENDMTLLSSSSDGTVKIWDFTALFQGGMDAAGFTQTVINPGAADFLIGNLNHPSYVYCARFHPDEKMEDKDIIATACFDGKVRIWLVTYPLDHVVERATTELAESLVLSTIDIIPESRYDYQEIMGSLYNAKTEAERRLEMQKLTEDQENERRHPNYLTFDNSGQLFIADSVGMVHIWSVQLRGDHVSTTLIRQIENDELSGDAINTLILTPPERRELIVQSRDNVIRIVEPGRGNKATSQGLIIRRFFGASVQKYSLRACVSPDGQYLASGSEDGKVHIWDVASGFKTDVSTWGVSCQHLVADVCWNPCYHMVAIALFGSEYPVLVFTYQKTRDEVEQNLLEFQEPKKGEILAPHKDQRGPIAKEMGIRALPKRELF